METWRNKCPSAVGREEGLFVFFFLFFFEFGPERRAHVVTTTATTKGTVDGSGGRKGLWTSCHVLSPLTLAAASADSAASFSA